MSELKMSDWFKLPVDCSHLVDNSGVAGITDSICIDGQSCLTDHHVEKVEIAINSYDSHVEQIAKLTKDIEVLRSAALPMLETLNGYTKPPLKVKNAICELSNALAATEPSN